MLACEDEALLVRGDALLVLDLMLQVLDRVRRLDVQRDGLARQRLDEDLRARGRFSALCVSGPLWSQSCSLASHSGRRGPRRRRQGPISPHGCSLAPQQPYRLSATERLFAGSGAYRSACNERWLDGGV